MPELQVITDWTVTGIGYWKIGTTFVVSGSATSSSLFGNIADRVKSYQITRGRSNELDRYSQGELSLVLDNNGEFLPLNTSGPLSGSLVPGRSVQLKWIDDSGSVFKRFTGKTISYVPEPNVTRSRDVVITCADDFEGFQRQETRSAIFTNIRSGCLIGSILNDAGTASRSIDTGGDIYEYAFFDQRKIDEVLVDINQTEYGFIFFRGDGYFVFHDRNYRSKTTTVSASFIETMSGITYRRDSNDLKTQARVTVMPRVVKPSATVWSINSPVVIGPSSAASFFGSYIDSSTCRACAAAGVASPGTAANIQFNSNASGTGTDLSASFSACLTPFAESFRVVASNAGATTGYITRFNVTGSPVVSYEQLSRTSTASAACALYGLRTLSYDAQLQSDAEKGQSMADFLVNRYSNPVNTDRVTMTIVNGDTTLWGQIFARELDDRISVTASEVGLTGEMFFIGRLNESYDSSTGLHEVTWDLEKFGVEDGFFLVDSSVVGGNKGLGY